MKKYFRLVIITVGRGTDSDNIAPCSSQFKSSVGSHIYYQVSLLYCLLFTSPAAHASLIVKGSSSPIFYLPYFESILGYGVLRTISVAGF